MGDLPVSLDTRKEVATRQYEALRRLGLEGRAAMTFELSDNMRAVVEAGIRRRHPEYGPEEVKLAWFKLTLDKELFEAAFPGCEIES